MSRSLFKAVDCYKEVVKFMFREQEAEKFEKQT